MISNDRQLRLRLTNANRMVRSVRSQLPAGQDVDMRKGTVWLRRPRRQVDLYQVWFRTRGCTFDRAGQCSMCNYGTGPEIDPNVIAAAVETTLARIPPGNLVYVSPSGSLLDEHEVPPRLRLRILRAVAARQPMAFTFETRPELCTPENIDNLLDLLPGTSVSCHLGVESWDEDVRRLCHLKPTRQAAYLAAVRMLRSRRVAPIANIALGGLGLSEHQAFVDAAASVRGTRTAGFSIQMLFPLSAKRGTLLDWAGCRGLWSPPSLWTLVAALSACVEEGLAEDGTGDLDISWFNPDIGSIVRARPDGCPACRPMLIDTLRAFRLRPGPDALDAAVTWSGCSCRRRSEPDAPETSYRERLAEVLARWEAEGVPAAARAASAG